jgi:hypothetical protein
MKNFKDSKDLYKIICFDLLKNGKTTSITACAFIKSTVDDGGFRTLDNQARKELGIPHILKFKNQNNEKY